MDERTAYNYGLGPGVGKAGDPDSAEAGARQREARPARRLQAPAQRVASTGPNSVLNAEVSVDYGLAIRRVVLAVLARPSLWPATLRAAWRFRSRNWYGRFPFLPLPAPEYLAWRLHTAYGSGERQPEAMEVIRYVRWTDWMTRGTGKERS